MRNFWKKNIAKALAVGLAVTAAAWLPLQAEAAEEQANAGQQAEILRTRRACIPL